MPKDGSETQRRTDIIYQHSRIKSIDPVIQSESPNNTPDLKVRLDKIAPGSETTVPEKVADYLDPCCLRIGQAHDALERRQHGVGHIVGYRPDKEERSKKNKGNRIGRDQSVLFYIICVHIYLE